MMYLLRIKCHHKALTDHTVYATVQTSFYNTNTKPQKHLNN